MVCAVKRRRGGCEKSKLKCDIFKPFACSFNHQHSPQNNPLISKINLLHLYHSHTHSLIHLSGTHTCTSFLNHFHIYIYSIPFNLSPANLFNITMSIMNLTKNIPAYMYSILSLAPIVIIIMLFHEKALNDDEYEIKMFNMRNVRLASGLEWG
jgi:hypothetical protein